MRAGLILLVTLALAGIDTASAGTLELTNGAVLPGEFRRIEGSKVIWEADLIGEIRVEASDIAQMESTAPEPLRVDGVDLPERCALQASGAKVTVACADLAPITTSWAEVGRPGRAREGSGKITTALTYERGNSYSDEFEFDAVARWRYQRLRHKLEATIDYEEKRQGKTEDEATLDYQLDYLLRDDWYVYGRTEYARDRFATVQEGLLAGIGIGRTWDFANNLDLLVQAGPDFGYFDIQNYGRLKENGGNLQWRIDYERSLWKFDIKLFHEGEFAWIFRDTDLNRLDTKSGIELPLLYGILAELRLEYDRIGVSLPEVDNTDIEWVFALGYKW
jgi:hypothetical protein